MLGRLRARYLQSRLPGFFDWWFGELRALLPQRWQAYLRVQQTQLLLRRQDAGLALLAAEGGGVEPLATLDGEGGLGEGRLEQRIGSDAARLPRILLLPPEAVLLRRLSFPVASSEERRVGN